MAQAQPSICPGIWDALTPLGFWNTNGSPYLGLATRPCNNDKKIKTKQKKKKKKKRTCRIVNLAVPADHRVELKEREKKDK